ncbi:hypothetical protein QUF56_12145 [Ureibacillus composti]|nr:hypothetical protein [Ureibacillus composti]
MKKYIPMLLVIAVFLTGCNFEVDNTTLASASGTTIEVNHDVKPLKEAGEKDAFSSDYNNSYWKIIEKVGDEVDSKYLGWAVYIESVDDDGALAGRYSKMPEDPSEPPFYEEIELKGVWDSEKKTFLLNNSIEFSVSEEDPNLAFFSWTESDSGTDENTQILGLVRIEEEVSDLVSVRDSLQFRIDELNLMEGKAEAYEAKLAKQTAGKNQIPD